MAEHADAKPSLAERRYREGTESLKAAQADLVECIAGAIDSVGADIPWALDWLQYRYENFLAHKRLTDKLWAAYDAEAE